MEVLWSRRNWQLGVVCMHRDGPCLATILGPQVAALDFHSLTHRPTNPPAATQPPLTVPAGCCAAHASATSAALLA